jgi:hypothetical protein
MKRGKVSLIALVLGFSMILAVAHLIGHIVVFGSPFEGGTGVSGLVVGDLSYESLKGSYDEMSALSRTIIIGEWALIFMILFIAVARRVNSRIKLKKDLEGINLSSYGGSKTKTDIDVLHDILKEKKHLRMSSISEIFKIEYNLAMEWGKILESGDLATIRYPMLGEPEVVIAEEPIQAVM